MHREPGYFFKYVTSRQNQRDLRPGLPAWLDRMQTTEAVEQGSEEGGGGVQGGGVGVRECGEGWEQKPDGVWRWEWKLQAANRTEASDEQE